jgi:serine/threonine protein kinase
MRNALEIPDHAFAKAVAFTAPERPRAATTPRRDPGLAAAGSRPEAKPPATGDTIGANRARAAMRRLRTLGLLSAFAVVVLGAVILGDVGVLAVSVSAPLRYAALGALAVSCALIVGSYTRMSRLARPEPDARRLGSYELVELLGKGGMGEVWRAEHHSLVRPAAVKVLRRELTSHLTDSQVNAMNLRFQREVQATAQLTSPHTVAVYDYGQTTDGILYYAMELLNGVDAETLVRTHGPQPAERVVSLLRQACESLAEAHHRHLVHRDIKPANLLLCALGLDVDFVKVLDFGLVHDLDHDTRLTIEGSISGTPAYLAPESAAHNRFDTRSDVYALACVAYWLLTGTIVFDGDTAAGVMTAHIRDQPDPPSRRTELPIPAELEDLILACLAKDPADRPQSVEELSRRLAAVPLARRWTQARAERWWQAHMPRSLAKARAGCDDIELSQLRRRPSFVIRNSVAS